MKEPRRIIRWSSPPPVDPRGDMTRGRRDECGSGGLGSQWDAVAACLRDRPGEWAVIATGDRNTIANIATQIRTGSLACFRPAGAFVATRRVVRTVGGINTVDLYVRYADGAINSDGE